jgi:hypothetical protein
MENKQQDRALDIPAEANRDKHMNYPAVEEGDTKSNNDEEIDDDEKRRKHDADSGNDSTNQMLQKEKKIDPGNEHNHLHNERDQSTKHDADAGGDGTGTMGSKPE